MIVKSAKHLFIRIFLLTTIPFGVILGLFFWYFYGAEYGLKAGVYGGFFYGLAMTVILGGIQLLSTGRLKTAGVENLLGVHQVEVVSVHHSYDQAYDFCRQALLELKGCSISEEDRELGIIRGLTDASWKSFGEKIVITVSPLTDQENRVTISSKPTVGTTVLDYGKNVENMRAMKKCLTRIATVTESPLPLESQADIAQAE